MFFNDIRCMPLPKIEWQFSGSPITRYHLQGMLHVSHMLIRAVTERKPPARREEEALLHRQQGQQDIVLGHESRHLCRNRAKTAEQYCNLRRQ